MTGPGASIRVRDWLAGRAPSPPPALAQRLTELVGDDRCASPAELPEYLLSRSQKLLARVETDRSAATDLLAADALITYAMEAAAEYGFDVDAIAANAAMRLAGNPTDGGQA